MTVTFELECQPFTAKGGPVFKVQRCDLIGHPLRDAGRDRLLLAEAHGGRRRERLAVRLAQGQVRRVLAVVPSLLPDLFKDAASPGAQRAMQAMLQMKKLDAAKLKAAYDGK